MNVVILAGGYGTRLSEYTDVIPKPMVTIGGKPIIFHIMNHYAKFGYKNFIIALGYKSEVIKDYFLNLHALSSDFSVDLSNGEVEYNSQSSIYDWKVNLVDTGEASLTGTRLLKLRDYLSEPFMLTYGDGLSNVNINRLVHFHKTKNKLLTLTAVRPSARFGELTINSNGDVKGFIEKPQLHQGWINGGFFVCEPDFLNLIPDDDVMLEREPIIQAVKEDKISAYMHDGFWQCMDTKRDRDYLEDLYINGAPWA